MSRPSSYTIEIAETICSRIAEGRSVRSISQDEDMPAEGTIYSWLYKNIEFQEKYALAREAQADVYAEEIIEIADDGTRDTYKDDDGHEQTNHDVIARSRLRVDARKWVASKLKPKKYGDKQDLNITGKLETTPDDQIDARIAQLLGKAGTPAFAGGETETGITE